MRFYVLIRIFDLIPAGGFPLPDLVLILGLGFFAVASICASPSSSSVLGLDYRPKVLQDSIQMSSPCPVLRNKHIDQWKVTELKEELRRRKLKINGLKEELVRRLDEALHSEMEEAEKEELGTELDPDNSENKVDEEESGPASEDNNTKLVEDQADKVNEEKSAPLQEENIAEPVEAGSCQDDKDAAMVDNIESSLDVNQSTNDQDQKEMIHTILDVPAEDTKEDAVLLEKSASDSQGIGDQLESSDEKNEDSKPIAEDAALAISEPTNQVSEVNPYLGFKVKSNSISTDSVSINEKNELKDNLNANNVNLELEVVKPEMVQPSSHLIEDDRELLDDQTSLEEAGNLTCATNMELSQKMEGVYEGSPEKLNLDRSSGDESMEEDVLDSKQNESNNDSGEEDRKEDMEDVEVGGFSPDKKDMISEGKTKSAAVMEKRKAEEQEAVNTNNEPKRQRRWNLDSVKAPDPQTYNVTNSATKDALQPALRRSFTRSDSSLGGDEPKERIVPPSQKPATTSLRIDHFLRPFTLKAVQELLAKTGTISDFWMDQIKTHCYATYSSIDEAIATRNELFNLRWPTNGGRLLVAEFVDPQEVKSRLEPTLRSLGPATPSAPTARAPPPSRLPSLKQQQPSPSLPNPPPARDQLPLPLSAPRKKVDSPPITTLDDLFKKTMAMPRIYYLPLTEEQVAAKIQAGKGKST